MELLNLKKRDEHEIMYKGWNYYESRTTLSFQSRLPQHSLKQDC